MIRLPILQGVRARGLVLIEMGGFIFCDECIEAAAQIVAERKAGG